jgi:hypothetical protein
MIVAMAATASATLTGCARQPTSPSAVSAAASPSGQPATSASAASTAPDTSADLRIISKPIEFNQERMDLTLAYRRLHQDPNAKDIFIHPKMIILHWTGINFFDSTWNYFNRTRAEAERKELAQAGDVNVSAHFLVDRDGTVYQLMPETWMARHCIGLNHVAIGIENVGDGEKFPLTAAQVKSNAALVRYLAKKYPIQYLIGHMEYRHMERTALFLEHDPKYRNTKPDPGAGFMDKVRVLVADLKLLGAPPRANR